MLYSCYPCSKYLFILLQSYVQYGWCYSTTNDPNPFSFVLPSFQNHFWYIHLEFGGHSPVWFCMHQLVWHARYTFATIHLQSLVTYIVYLQPCFRCVHWGYNHAKMFLPVARCKILRYDLHLSQKRYDNDHQQVCDWVCFSCHLLWLCQRYYCSIGIKVPYIISTSHQSTQYHGSVNMLCPSLYQKRNKTDHYHSWQQIIVSSILSVVCGTSWYDTSSHQILFHKIFWTFRIIIVSFARHTRTVCSTSSYDKPVSYMHLW